MKKIYYYSLASILMLGAISCNDDFTSDQLKSNPDETIIDSETINKNGSFDGLSYSLNNLEVNPELLIIKNDNAKLTSTNVELSEGTINLSSVDESTASSLIVGKTIYIHIGNYNELRKIEDVAQLSESSYKLITSQAQLNEIFQDGSLQLSLDLYESTKIQELKNNKTKAAVEYSHEILNLDDIYNFNGIEYNPATNIKMLVNTGITFSKTQILPSQIKTVFEIRTAINPSVKYAGAISGTYKNDLIQYIPQQVIDLIKAQEFEIKIPVNTLGIDSLPATIRIEDINIPTEIEANLSKASYLGYNVNGSFKIGYIVDIKGLSATTTPIYENNITTKNPSTSSLNGELLTKSDIAITPAISILNNAYSASGDITFGISTESNGNINPLGKTSIFGSKGIFKSNMTVMLDLILLKVPITIFNNEVELWNVGTLDRTLTFSDLKYNVTSKYTANLINATRVYETELTLNYAYAILGKKVPENLIISYEIYQDNGTTLLATEKDKAITLSNITNKDFKFKLNIPYKRIGGILSSKYETTGYIKNIKISDSRGYSYDGILNTSTNTVENNIAIKR